ncbi:unnamed protein product [Oppiella nova]|uniref:Cytochrome c oxidase subunit n=1 Tax=Oppiella nova TaxID=334625 RepID=A0A7R9MFE1_9ACAR|nr:unnamed protein product [Oppiella nova]CAG2175381.1 unnamed protein product [Oppiella nova]
MGGFGSKPKDKTKHPEVGAGGDITEEEVAKALTTTSYDPRFPNQNQTRNCYQNYLDYHRCLKVKDNDEDFCGWYKWAYTQLCPKAWIRRTNGTIRETEEYLPEEYD